MLIVDMNLTDLGQGLLGFRSRVRPSSVAQCDKIGMRNAVSVTVSGGPCS